MDSNQEEEGETIEFYKIQVMEKDREISDFQAKIKKIEFKHNRQIKEAKTGQERAKTLLKEEKSKVDKLSKQAKQNQQQNNILQMRLNQLKESKQKELLQIRVQYNSIKQQIRSYEKILPTHTFLIEIDKSINQLPAYEDIFMSLKDKGLQLQELNNKFEAFKLKTSEDIDCLHQNEQNLKIKKIEAEFSLKEMLSKIIDYEHTINDLKILSDDYQTRLEEFNDLLILQKSRSNQLQQNLRQFQSKVEQMEHAFAHQMQNKVNQQKEQLKQQMQRLQNQNRSLESRLQLKESSFVNQISIYQEQITSLQNKCHADKEKYQQQLNQARETYNELKKKLEKSNQHTNNITHKNQELIDNLRQVSLRNEELQEEIIQLKRRQEQIQKTYTENQQHNKKNSRKFIQEAQKHCQQLQIEIANLKQTLASVTEEKQGLQEQLTQLRDQIQGKRGSFTESKLLESLDIPSSSELQYFQKYRRKSMECGYEEQMLQIQQREDLIRERKTTEQSLKGLENLERNDEVIKGQLYDFKNTIQLLQNRWQKSQELNRQKQKSYLNLQQSFGQLQNKQKSLLLQLSSQSQKIAVLSSKNAIIQLQKTAILAQKQILLEQNFHEVVLKENIQNQYKNKLSKVQQQILIMKAKNQYLSKENAEIEHSNENLNKKIDLYKTKNQSHQQQIKFLSEQSKKDKEMIKIQREELKNQKQLININGDRQMKTQKDSMQQIQVLKQEKQRLKSQFQAKQKKLMLDIDRFNNNLSMEQKLKQQIKQLTDQIKARDHQLTSIKHQIYEINKEKQELRKQNQLLEEENQNKDRQNEIISGSLDRQRRQRTLRSVPSLQSLNGELQQAQEETFNDIYSIVTKKQGEINILQRQISDLKEQIESMKVLHNSKFQAIEIEQRAYIQTIIEMKMRCAQSQMKASEKQYLYSKLKKKMDMMTVP